MCCILIEYKLMQLYGHALEQQPLIRGHEIYHFRQNLPWSSSKADPAPARRARAPLFEIFYWCIFGNFNSITRINFIVINMQCLQYVFLFSTLSTKAKGMCEEASKQSSDLKNYTAPVPRPRVFKFLDLPLIITIHLQGRIQDLC